jgi:acylphosphatase
MPQVGRHVRITGRVQGVFFRQSAVDRARELGVSGWVRNCPDGSVEARLSGTAEAVEAMTQWLRQGPPSARVERIDVEDVGPETGDRFTVRY